MDPPTTLFPMKFRVLSLHQDCAFSFWNRTTPYQCNLMDKRPNLQASNSDCLFKHVIRFVQFCLFSSVSSKLTFHPPSPQPPKYNITFHNEGRQDLLPPAFHIFERPFCIGLFDSLILISVEINCSF